MKPFYFALLVGVSTVAAQPSYASEPPQFVSEVIPVKHVRGADIAAAILRMTTNAVSTASTNAGNASSLGSHSSGQSPVIYDERSNSLLIYATPQDMQKIKALVSKLDVVGAQVLIEAVIMDISLDAAEDSSLSTLDPQFQGSEIYPYGASVIGRHDLLSVTPIVSHATTNASAGYDSAFSYLARLGNDLDATLPALAGDSRVKSRLQRPRIQTSMGESATIYIGVARPYPTSSYHTGGVYSGDSLIQQLQIGVTLELTPRLNPDGLIVMDIHQTIAEIAGIVGIANVSDLAITKSREGQAKVSMRDHETIMLGGLINTVTNRVSSGVPLLKSIPLLGSVFRRASTRTTRGEIVTLIRPTLLPATNAVAALSRQTGSNLAKGN